MARALRRGGGSYVSLVTDLEELARYMADHFAASPHFKPLLPSPFYTGDDVPRYLLDPAALDNGVGRAAGYIARLNVGTGDGARTAFHQRWVLREDATADQVAEAGVGGGANSIVSGRALGGEH